MTRRTNKRYNQVQSSLMKYKAERRVRKQQATRKDVLYLIVAGIVLIGVLNSLQGLVSKIGSKVNEGVKAQSSSVYTEVALPFPSFSPSPKPSPTPPPVDPRINKLKSFLKSHSSPLEPYAELMVNEADRYDIGWTKLAAISGMESDYCKQTIAGSYNCWGLGGSNFMYFQDYPAGIKYASWLMGTQYQWNENQGIKAKYCPATDGCNPEWATAVTSFTNEILALKEEK